MRVQKLNETTGEWETVFATKRMSTIRVVDDQQTTWDLKTSYQGGLEISTVRNRVRLQQLFGKEIR